MFILTPPNSPSRPPIPRLSQTQSSSPDEGAGAPEVTPEDASCF